MHATEKIAELIKQYIEGKLNAEELASLSAWRKADAGNEAFFQSIIQGEEIYHDALLWISMEKDDREQQLEELKHNTLARIRPKKHAAGQQRLKSNLIYIGIAALLLSICLFSYLRSSRQPEFHQNIEASSIFAGSNKAELTLSDGQKIKLRTDKDGIILSEELTCSDGTPVPGIDREKLSQTTASLSVPLGGKYKITLSDGTKVHLNAQSKLTYPLKFNSKARQVSIEGEGYFEVSKQYKNNILIPFEVSSKDQTIIVTGTSFNISAYTDDAQTVTTLVEGSVEIQTAEARLSLQPNEQASVIQGRIDKKHVDIVQYVAWKDGNFLFFETELHELMKQIGRWYAVEVSYPKPIPPTYFYGEIAREKNLAEVLRILEKAGVKFKLNKEGSQVRLQVIK